MCLLWFLQVLSNSVWKLAILDALQYASFSPGGNVDELIGYKLTFCKVCVLTKYFYVL